MKSFSFKMPTRFVFGRDMEDEAGRLVAHYGGTKVLVLYGDASVRRSGLLERVRESLERALLDFVELGGVQAASQTSSLYEGISLVRDEHVDFVLALGGRHVVDTAKGIAAGARYWGDVWDFYGGDNTPDEALPIGCISTTLDAGSTASCDSVLVGEDGCACETFSRAIVPTFSILDSALTLDEPADRERGDLQRLSGELAAAAGTEGDGADDSLSAALMGAVDELVQKRIAQLEADPGDLDARGELMWASAIVSSGFISAGSERYRNR